MHPARLAVLVRTGDQLRLCEVREIVRDRPLLLGREADVGVGVDPVDTKVSRLAATVTLTDHGWAITAANRNGIVAHPWAQHPGMIENEWLMSWPRLGLRVLGSPDRHHWVLLDDPLQCIRREETPSTGATLTESAELPRPLTEAQEAAVRCLFQDLLAWPPRGGAQARQIKQVASRLGVRAESIQRRLEDVRRKATAVGLARHGLLTDPEYLYVLVRAGYLQPSRGDLDPLLVSHFATPG